MTMDIVNSEDGQFNSQPMIVDKLSEWSLVKIRVNVRSIDSTALANIGMAGFDV